MVKLDSIEFRRSETYQRGLAELKDIMRKQKYIKTTDVRKYFRRDDMTRATTMLMHDLKLVSTADSRPGLDQRKYNSI